MGDAVREDTSSPGPRVRLAELLAAVSLATDMAHDVPPESALRDALLQQSRALVDERVHQPLHDVVVGDGPSRKKLEKQLPGAAFLGFRSGL